MNHQTERQLTILVMDDEPLLLSSVTMLLETLGHNVLNASHGQAALDIVADGQNVDVGILDVSVPNGLGAKDIVGELRESCPNIKLVVSTGYAITNVDDGEYSDFDAALAKPFSVADIHSLMETLFPKPSES